MKTKEKVLEELDDISRQIHGLSFHIASLVDELDPTWRKRMEKARKDALKDFQI